MEGNNANHRLDGIKIEEKIMANQIHTAKNGNYVSTVVFVHGLYTAKVLCMTGTHCNGDVVFLRSYKHQKAAINAANKKMNLCANA